MTTTLLIIAGLATLGALGTILLSHPLWCATSLVVHLLAVAVIFMLQGATFVGTMQILLYAGAIVVLILFVIMILGLTRTGRRWVDFPFHGSIAITLSFALVITVSLVTLRGSLTGVGAPPTTLTDDYGSIANVGTVLFKDYLIPFEAVSVLLLVAVVGAVVLGKRKAG